jgi:hypothetical protein
MPKRPQTQMATYNLNVHDHREPRTDSTPEGITAASVHNLPLIGQLQKRVREDSNNPPEDGDVNKKLRKEDKTSMQTNQKGTKQPAATKASRRKGTAKTKAEGDQALAQLEDQGHWSDEDTKLLLETLLGGESLLYDKLVTNAKYVYKKVVD